jgi:hypothetical protein
MGPNKQSEVLAFTLDRLNTGSYTGSIYFSPLKPHNEAINGNVVFCYGLAHTIPAKSGSQNYFTMNLRELYYFPSCSVGSGPNVTYSRHYLGTDVDGINTTHSICSQSTFEVMSSGSVYDKVIKKIFGPCDGFQVEAWYSQAYETAATSESAVRVYCWVNQS